MVEHDNAAVQRDDDGITSAVDINSVGKNPDNSDIIASVAGVGKDDGRQTPNAGDGQYDDTWVAAMWRTNGGVNTTDSDGRQLACTGQ